MRTCPGTQCHIEHRARGRTLRYVVALLLTTAAADSAADIVIGRFHLRAETRAQVERFIFQPPFIDTEFHSNSEFETADYPGYVPQMSFTEDSFLFDGRPGDFHTEATTIVVGTQSSFAAAVQDSTSNAVSASSIYTDLRKVNLQSRAEWVAEIVNTGSIAEAVDFGFYISSGGMRINCTVCVTGPLVATVFAGINVETTVFDDPWRFEAKLSGFGTFRPQLTPQTVDAHDTLGIGFPTVTSEVEPTGPGEAPSAVAEVAPFTATTRLGMLDPMEHMIITYYIGAQLEGPGSAFGAAWMVDPFSLGDPDALPPALFTINGQLIDFAVAPVPVPAAGILLIGPLFLLLRRRRVVV